MKITDKQLTKISQMMDSNKPESQILSWVESQENSEQIFEYFNKFMQGYVGQEKKKSPKR